MGVVHREFLKSLNAFLPEVVDSLTSHLGGKSPPMCFCMGGLPVAGGVACVSVASVHCAEGSAIWTTQGQCFPKEGRMKERGLTPQPQGDDQMAKCLFSLDDSEQPSHPRKANLILSSAIQPFPLPR
jgi:hypothetical protein